VDRIKEILIAALVLLTVGNLLMTIKLNSNINALKLSQENAAEAGGRLNLRLSHVEGFLLKENPGKFGVR
jgi:hypothetical protein